MPKGSRILMADDDKMLIDMYKERLELAGYQVSICRDGEEALTQVRQEKPDIILLDIMMPKANGYEVLASLKSDPQTKDVPVVMLSALMRDFNREKAVEAGADDYLIKSEAMPSDVITKIEQVLQKYGKGGAPVTADPSKILFTPSSSTQEAPKPPVSYIETQPIVEPKPPVAPPAPPKAEQPPVAPLPAKEKPKGESGRQKPSIVLVVILTILLTVLVNDALMYYFFIWKK